MTAKEDQRFSTYRAFIETFENKIFSLEEKLLLKNQELIRMRDQHEQMAFRLADALRKEQALIAFYDKKPKKGRSK